MVDIRTETKPQHGKPANPRDAIRAARQRRLRLIQNGKPATIRVFAANEALQEVLRHPTNNIRFRGALAQGVEWPNDSFTQRRIKEGSVLTEAPGSSEPIADNESLNPRQQSLARYGRQALEDQANKTLRLASLSPNTAVSGSADFVLSCIGTGFTKDTVMQFGAHDEPTTLVSATEVTTIVKPSLFVPDVVPVLVHTATETSEPLNFTFTAPEPTKAKPAA